MQRFIMEDKQKQYIEKHVDLIETNNWQQFFYYLPSWEDTCPEGTGALLYMAGIDFLSEFGRIPHRQFAFSDITEIKIPDNITYIPAQAFQYCSKLETVIMTQSIKKIDEEAFAKCHNINIIFDGTKQDWLDLLKTGKNIFLNTRYICTCNDGVVVKSR